MSQGGYSFLVPDDLKASIVSCVMAHSFPPTVIIYLDEEVQQMTIAEFIQQLFGDVQGIVQVIAPIAAVIGFVGLGIMYMGSS